MFQRTLASLAVFALASIAFAQSPGFSFYRAATPVDRSQLKLIIQAVKDVDPSADVFHSDDMTILQIRHQGALTEQVYRHAIEQAGIGLLAGSPTAEELGLNQVPVGGPPVYAATGDDAADQARYAAAVEQWNVAHPDQQLSTTPVHLR